MILITTNRIDEHSVFDQIKDDRSGAVVIFTGHVKDNNLQERVKSIFYEAYEEMVKDVLKKIEKETFEIWNINKFIAIHRIGNLVVGEISVIVAVSSSHRRDAFEACSYGIDNIKKRCPIWKKENTGSNDMWSKGVNINE